MELRGLSAVNYVSSSDYIVTPSQVEMCLINYLVCYSLSSVLKPSSKLLLVVYSRFRWTWEAVIECVAWCPQRFSSNISPEMFCWTVLVIIHEESRLKAFLSRFNKTKKSCSFHLHPYCKSRQASTNLTIHLSLYTGQGVVWKTNAWTWTHKPDCYQLLLDWASTPWSWVRQLLLPRIMPTWLES